MKAIVFTKYGTPDVLELREVEKPIPKNDEVLIKVYAVSINDWDWGLLQGIPFINRLRYGLLRPKKKILGSDVAGRIEAVGKNVEQFQPGDEVFGDLSGEWGGFAEYVCARENALALKPAGMTFEEAAAIPQAAMLAIQGLCDKGQIQSGQKLLINGAGGGVGTFAIQKQHLAKVGDKPTTLAAMTKMETEVDWPGFLGPNRDGIIRGVRIETDWSKSPPVELWRRPIGPGWSSFAVRGDVFYTQEQRGDDEVVACYKVSTGEPVWKHSDAARFWESNGGAGPRGTPTLSDGRVYTFGGTGIMNVLDAGDGAVVWSRNAASDAKAKLPYWGFSSSPLVVDDLVIVAASGALVAYDLATGGLRWSRPDSSASYSSPHLFTIAGVTQILTLRETGLTSVTPADGTLLWEHSWPGYPIVQPAQIPNSRDDILISVSAESGIRRLAVAPGPGGWTVEERWTSIQLKPYYSEFVVHDGHAFGFDGSILACIDLKDGARKWKGGRYGAGQLVLLADEDLLLVLSEKGELALVGTAPDQFTELARFPAIKGKTWNHPVLVGDVLLVRNAQEMVAFRLSLAGG